MSSQQQEEDPNFKYDPIRKMLACKIFGKEDLRMVDSPVPMVADPADAVIRITASAICGSDLHMYHARTPGGEFNNIIGHECVGIVDEVGSGVSKLKKGQRVVVSAVLCCGSCEYCQRQEWSCCDITLVNKALAAHPSGCHSGSLLGFSHRLGGYDGCQAEYVRVPFADVNCFPIPDDVDDKQALTIADVACTGYHGTQLADIKQGDDVAVFGAGPVGLMAQMWAVYKGANKVVAIDVDDYRLGFAQKHFGVEAINLSKVDPITAVKKYFPKGPNKVIDCAGYIPPAEEPKVKKGIYPEASTLMTLNAAIAMIRKNGRISLIGKYVGHLNNFHIGGMMEKHLTISGGQVWPQAYYPHIFKAMQSGKVNPAVVFTHNFPLSQCDQAYRMFDRHEGGIIKALLVPDSILSQRGGKF